MNPIKNTRTDITGIADVRATDIVSSAIIGPCAKRTEQVKLFAHPYGHPIPRLGGVPANLFPTHTAFTTNMTCSCQLGAALGDAVISYVRADFVGGSLQTIQTILSNTMFRFKVCSRVVMECGLRDLPHVFTPKCRVAQNDSIEGVIEVTEYIEDIDPVLIRIVMPSVIKYDIR